MRRSSGRGHARGPALALALLLSASRPVLAGSPFDPPDPLELRVLGHDRWLARSRFALRVLVRDARRDRPLEADVTISLARSGERGRGEWRRLWEGRTGPLGTADLSLKPPDLPPGSYLLAVEVACPLGRDRIERPLTLAGGIDVALVTDRPRYRPGDVVHARGLALRRPSLRAAADLDVPIEIEDPRGNRIYHHRHRTSRFGWLDLDFPLASEVLPGTYRLRAVLPDGAVEGTFVAGPDAPPSSGAEAAPAPEPSSETLAIHAVAEGGRLAPLLENTVFLRLSYGDGRPVPWAHVRATTGGSGGTSTEHTADALGIVELHLVPQSLPLALAIQARDDDGHETAVRIELPGRPRGDALVLTLDRALARPGDRVQATVVSTRASGPVYLDVVAHGQTVLAKAAALERGRAEVTIALPVDATGAIEIRAYDVTSGGEVVGDARRVVVDPALATAARVEVVADERVYAAGDGALLAFTVRDGRGAAAEAELAVSVLAGDGFAPGAAAPGREQAHFALAPAPALLAPGFALHGWTAADLVLQRPAPLPGPPTPLALAAGRERAARVLLAAAPPAIEFPLRADGYDDRLALAKTRWLEAIVRDAAAIQRAIDLYHRPGAGKHAPLADKDALVRLVNLKLLVARGAQDPWGNRYRAGLDGRRLAWLKSAGPDAEFGSRDDVGLGDPEAGPRPAQVDPAAAAPATAPVAAAGTATPTGATLLWRPLVPTGDNGEATVEVALGDSAATRQVTVVAAGPDGLIGAAVLPLLVDPGLIMDVALPPALTRGDEVRVPVTLRGRSAAEAVSVELDGGPGLRRLEPQARRAVALDPGEERVESFRVAALVPGRAELAITARGARAAQQVRAATAIHADGRPMAESVSGRLAGASTLTLRLPGSAIAGTASAIVRFDPGPLAAATTALDALAGGPVGSFDAAWATARVSASLADSLQRSSQDPALAARTLAIAATSYQRLLTYETPGGGFSQLGDPPADPLLTARGLLALHDLSQILPIDPRVAHRAEAWLATVAWDAEPADLAVTAEVAWTLLGSGRSDPGMGRVLDSISARVEGSEDPRTLALATGALAAGGGPAAALDRTATALAALATSGQLGTATLETSALAALALWRAGRDVAAAEQATDALELARDPEGTWGDGPATVAALQALHARARGGAADTVAVVAVLLNGTEIGHFVADRDTADTPRVFDLGPGLRSGENRVELRLAGSGSLPYQIVSRYHLPWREGDAATDPATTPLSLAVDYAPREVARGEVVRTRATVSNRGDRAAGVVVLEVGLPPGFTPERAALDALVAAGAVRSVRAGERALVFHLAGIEPGASRTIEIELRSGPAERVKTPPSRAYELALPARPAEVAPVVLQVRD